MLIRFLLLLTVMLCSRVGVAQTQLRTEYLMDSDPKIEVPPTVRVFSKRYLPLWQAALSSREQDMQRRAADTITRADELGMLNLIVTAPQLKTILTAESSQASVRYAAARALIAVEAKDEAATLWDASQRYGLDLRQLVEPALAEWDFAPSRALWIARLNDATVRHRDLLLAVRCLGEVREATALPRLRELALDTLQPADLRLEAAKSAGLLAESGLESDATQLAKDTRSSSLVSRLCSVRLLSRHTSPAARTQLIASAQDTEPAVMVAAMTRLLEIEPDLMLPLAESTLTNADPKVRQAGVDTYAIRPSPERMIALAKLLDDVTPTVRGNVRDALFRLAATPELNDSIRSSAMKQLAAESWRGQEQAALLLGALDHEPAAARLIELLEAKRSEVMVTAAWALRKLELPETLPAMFNKAVRQTKIRQETLWTIDLDQQVGHLLEAFGQLKYREADALLRQHVPKVLTLGERSRSAAIWSLGKLYEGKLDEALAQQLIARASDVASVPAESDLVRHMSSIALGRMGAVAHAKKLRDLMGPGPVWGRTGIAMRWAVMKLTDEKIDEPGPPTIGLGFSFLEPE